ADVIPGRDGSVVEESAAGLIRPGPERTAQVHASNMAGIDRTRILHVVRPRRNAADDVVANPEGPQVASENSTAEVLRPADQRAPDPEAGQVAEHRDFSGALTAAASDVAGDLHRARVVLDANEAAVESGAALDRAANGQARQPAAAAAAGD